MFPIPKGAVVGVHHGWGYTKEGKIWNFSRTVTIDGTSDQISSLPSPLPMSKGIGFQLNLVTFFYNDDTAKNHELRVYNGITPRAYAAFMTRTVDTAQPHFAQFGVEYKYTQLLKIDYVVTGTNGKTVDITIALEEL